MKKRKTFSEMVKQYRMEHELSQRKFAELVGVSRVTIRKIENGEKNLQLSKAGKVMKYIGIPVDFDLLK